MPRDTRSVGLALLLSMLIVTGVSTAFSLLFSPVKTAATVSACRQHYTVACLF
ncbi:MAG: hypothetical protein PHX93_03020 [Candidatus Peribacteraceae bacterium]|jgi:hypothetical protein|nr:hypothetical protein [Candidatus Peribacteraceae bacterium]